MRFGCFGFKDQIDDIAKSGFDTVELDLGELISMDKREFQAFEKKAQVSGLTFDVFSGLLPLSVRLHAEDFQREYWLAHVEKAAERATALGGKMIPFGAGKCRSIPENCSNIEAAKTHVADFVGAICDIFQKYNLEMVVEPLGPANSNYLNYIGETVLFAKNLKRENCHAMCDLRHMYKLGEGFEAIQENRSDILHAHIDYPRKDLRKFPQAKDDYNYQPYIDALYKAGYDRILTIEATWFENFREETERSCIYLKEMAQKAGYVL